MYQEDESVIIHLYAATDNRGPIERKANRLVQSINVSLRSRLPKFFEIFLVKFLDDLVGNF